MSVLTEATAGLRLPNSWLSGLGYEQFIGWYIWKKGYVLLINPRAKVRHLIHGQTLSRNITDSRKQLLGQVESQLLFYRLYGIEKDLSIMHRITWIIFRTLLVLKQAQNFHSVFLYFKGVIIGNTIGCKLLLLNKFGVRYDPIAELKGILEKSSS
jgi:hypothetical protein